MKFSEIIKTKYNRYMCKLWRRFNYNIIKHNTSMYGIPKVIWKNRIEIGDFCSINEGCFLHGAGGIQIGNNVIVSHGVSIISEGLNPQKLINGEYVHEPKPIFIGNHVWLCANSTILCGCTIADNVIIGAGSVVTKDCLQTCGLYAGVPAKLIKIFHKEEKDDKQ